MTSARKLLGWGLVGLAACASEPVEWTSPTRPSIDVEDELKPDEPEASDAYVLVRWDAWLYHQPNRASAKVRYTYDAGRWSGRRYDYGLPPGPGPATIPELQVRGLSFRLIADNGEWLELETLADAGAHHCHTSWWYPGQMRLRLHVERDHLLPVVTTFVERDYPDGTQVRLLPGKGLRRLDSSIYEVLADPYPYLLTNEPQGHSLRVKLGASEVGYQWTEQASVSDPPSPRPIWRDAVCAVSSDDAQRGPEAVVVGASLCGCLLRGWQQEHANQDVAWYEVDGGRTFAGRALDVDASPTAATDLVDLDLGCVQLRARLDVQPLGTPLRPLTRHDQGGHVFAPPLEGLGPIGQGRTLRAYWLDQSLAGDVRDNIRGAELLPDMNNPKSPCYAIAIRPDATADNTLELCLDGHEL